MKKYFALTLIVALASLLLLLGCKVHKEVSLGGEESTTEGKECEFVSECSETADICFQGKCLTEEELFSRFDAWTIDGWCDEGTCENCKDGNHASMIASGRDDISYRICADCMFDSACLEGLHCEVGKCVPE